MEIYNPDTRVKERVEIAIIGYQLVARNERAFFAGGYGSDGSRLRVQISEDAAFALSQKTGIPITPPPISPKRSRTPDITEARRERAEIRRERAQNEYIEAGRFEKG